MKTQKIIEKQDEYIKLLCKELDELAVLAYAHGWRSSRAEEGQRLREELAQLKAEAEKPSAEQLAYNKMKEQGFVSKDGVLNKMFEKPPESAEEICKDCKESFLVEYTAFNWDTGARRCLPCQIRYLEKIIASQKHLPTDEECKCINNNDIYMNTTILCRKCNKEVKTIRIRT